MPVHRILRIQVNRTAEVFDGLFKIKEPIPHEPPPVEWGCIALINLEHLIEVFECLSESLPTHLFSDGP